MGQGSEHLTIKEIQMAYKPIEGLQYDWLEKCKWDYINVPFFENKMGKHNLKFWSYILVGFWKVSSLIHCQWEL